jgi:hypothetical protein
MVEGMNSYPKPHPIVELIRSLWLLVVAVFIAVGIAVLVQMLERAWWWELPILAAFGFAVFVLLRNRRRSGG